ncbi:MAG TPA: EAL domain-containing protein [Solirubrobacteraceae bacterium]|nr:EAL domain-containing protein [Solirubrobacteraceae bacterium]
MHRQHRPSSVYATSPTLTGAAVRERLRGREWLVYLVVALALAVGYGLAHAMGPAWLRSGLVFNLIGGSAVVALVIGARRNTKSSRLPWYLFAIGVALFVTSGVLSWNYERLFGTKQPFPSVADQFHLAFYPFLIGGMVLLVRERRDHRDRAPLIDSMIVTTALATLLWVYLISPYAEQTGLSLLRRSASVAYPAMDILLLGVVARVAAGSHRREPAFQFVLAGAIVLLITDVIYGSVLLGGSGYGIGGALDAGWGIFYACLGAAALHPSMRLLSQRGPVPDTRLTRQRLALLGSASLTVPLVIVVRSALHQSVDLYVLVAASGIMFALVLLRLAGIVHHNEAATQREAALRVAGETLVSAPTREAIYQAALEAAHAVVDQPIRASLYVADSAEGALEPVGPGEAKIPGLPRILPQMLPGHQDSHSRVVTFQLAGSEVYLSPMFARDHLLGALAVVSEHQLDHPAQESLGTLASEVALALQSIAVTEEGAHQRSEARLTSLIKNSSDVICVVDPDSVIRYVSPSVASKFGYDPEGLAERPASEFVHEDDVQRLLAFVASVAGSPPGQPESAEFVVRHADGRWRNVEVLATNQIADEAIAGIVLNVRDISERKAFEAELEHQAFHDVLTGLPNRALFRDRVGHALAGQRRQQLPVAVLFMDVDDFKNVNDSLGHAAGDIVLQELGRRLEDCMRPVDTAARLGGDEFAILLHEAENEMQAVEVAQRVMNSLQAPITLENRDVTIATSIGIAFSDPTMISERDAEDLLRNADTAMYMAKESGKGHYQIFQPDMHARALERLELKTDLQRAIDCGEFTLRYQPIMDLRRGDIAGMEALVRWQHPTRGLVQPGDFIPLLEDTGLIVPVGRFVLREACHWAAVMQKEVPRDPPLSIAVNVSATQLQRPEFVDEVRQALKDSGIPPQTLTLELTESVMMQDLEVSLLRLNALRALKVKLAIDDFGTGYSSLNYLRQFPMDILKIDRSFLMDPNPDSEELTEAIVALARIFKLEAVAEGIESGGQVTQLQDIDCDYGQGFHFARPLSRQQILAMATAAKKPAQVIELRSRTDELDSAPLGSRAERMTRERSA